MIASDEEFISLSGLVIDVLLGGDPTGVALTR